MLTTETIKEQTVEEALNDWIQRLAAIAVEGKPFFKDDEFGFTFGSETDIYTVFLSKKINNILPFPQRKFPQ